jgi:hypothetical protein
MDLERPVVYKQTFGYGRVFAAAADGGLARVRVQNFG